MHSNIEKASRKSVMLDEYKKNILIALDMHINQIIKLIIKNSINSVIKEIVKNEYKATITLINKTCDQSSINTTNLNLSLTYVTYDATENAFNYQS